MLYLLPLLIVSNAMHFDSYRNILNKPSTRPIIGVLTQPSDVLKGSPLEDSTSYIGSSYVKSLEQAGARIVPVFHDAPLEEIDYIMEHVNGLVITGGQMELEKYIEGRSVLIEFVDMVHYIIEKAKQIN